jgi:hypothetical protein
MGASSTKEYCRVCGQLALRGVYHKEFGAGLLARRVLCEAHRKEYYGENVQVLPVTE